VTLTEMSRTVSLVLQARSHAIHSGETGSLRCQHQERAKIMIVSLTAQRASFIHAERAYPASSEIVKSSDFKSQPRAKNTGRHDDCHGGLLFPPERGELGLHFELRKWKTSLPRSRKKVPEVTLTFYLYFVPQLEQTERSHCCRIFNVSLNDHCFDIGD
jgi:hypothetical protein